MYSFRLQEQEWDSKEIFRHLEANYTQVFNDANLTEDYELGLRLFKLLQNELHKSVD
jgi:hypothetical protein